MSKDPPADLQPNPPSPPGNLSPRERAAAAFIGLAGVGVGGTGIFLSGNQAGTTAILLIGALFLLIAVQGTAILKVSKDGAELERRAASVALAERAVEAVQEKKDPGQAAELADAARRVYPAIAYDPTYNYLNSQIFQLRAFNAVSRALTELRSTGELTFPGGAVVVMEPNIITSTGWHPDAVVRTADGRDLLLIEMKSVGRQANAAGWRHLVGTVNRMKRCLQEQPDLKGLIVVEGGNVLVSDSSAMDGRLQIVGWFNEDDTHDLKEALRKLL